MAKPSLEEFFTHIPKPAPLSGNSAWASAKAQEIKALVHRAAERAPRSQQVHLGPSELGVECDRQIVSKLVGEVKTNHVSDPWPSILGTAAHAWLADAFEAADSGRWITEHRVEPHEEHSGTADLYDAKEYAVMDHKVLGDSSLNKIKSAGGPPRKYKAQLGLYGLGYMKQGKRVDRVALIAYPRTAPTLDALYVWEHPMDEELMALVREVLEDTKRRKEMAALVQSGHLPLDLVPRSPSADDCFFCPYYRPEAVRTGVGCPGTSG